MSENTIKMRCYRNGDERSIQKLFKQIFKHELELSHWHWKYKKNSQGIGQIKIAELGSDIVAQYCLMRNDINFIGKRILAGQSCDTIVREEFRGRQLFKTLAEQNYIDAKKNGLSAVFGFPNEQSLPGFIRSLKWHKIATLRSYCYRLGYEKIVGKKVDKILRQYAVISNLIRQKINQIRIRKDKFKHIVRNIVPMDLENLLKKYQYLEVLSVYKDIEYLKWRYQDHPNCNYKIHILYVDEIAEAFAVCRTIEDIVYICELIHQKKDVSETSLLLCYVIKEYLNKGAQKIMFYGHNDGFFDTVFTQSGFFKEQYSKLIFAGRGLGDDSLDQKLKDGKNWSISYGDTDII